MFSVVRILALFSAFLLALPAWAKPVGEAALGKEISRLSTKVEEFAFIRARAKELGLRAWLFGGTAAGLGHYARWHLQHEAGDATYQKERFDDDYTSIYRSTQDADIVVDGPTEKAAQLQTELEQKFGHLQGSKSVWEVRLLREQKADKLPLLGNPDFLNQHTDSNSTGLIELTTPPKGESPVRDLFHWEEKKPPFLRDLTDGTIHFYKSDLHNTTRFFREGRNPPILSVVRYLTKAFQFDLEIRPEDRRVIQEIIDKFQPAEVTQNAYVSHWLQKNGPKLFVNSVNIERSAKELTALGLTKKLQEASLAAGHPETEIRSLAWWLDKKPLPSFEVGQGLKQTAAELGIEDLAHETSDFLAYENITLSKKGDPNVFTSRTHKTSVGENAVYGEGFYAAKGAKGQAGTGFTLHLKLKPEARLGSDFEITPADTIRLLNRRAATLVPEQLSVSPVDWFRMLEEGRTFDPEERGAFEKLRRRVKNKIGRLTEAEKKEIGGIVLRALGRNDRSAKNVIEGAREFKFVAEEIRANPIDWIRMLAERPTFGAWNEDYFQELDKDFAKDLPKISAAEKKEITSVFVAALGEPREVKLWSSLATIQKALHLPLLDDPAVASAIALRSQIDFRDLKLLPRKKLAEGPALISTLTDQVDLALRKFEEVRLEKWFDEPLQRPHVDFLVSRVRKLCEEDAGRCAAVSMRLQQSKLGKLAAVKNLSGADRIEDLVKKSLAEGSRDYEWLRSWSAKAKPEERARMVRILFAEKSPNAAGALEQLLRSLAWDDKSPAGQRAVAEAFAEEFGARLGQKKSAAEMNDLLARWLEAPSARGYENLNRAVLDHLEKSGEPEMLPKVLRSRAVVDRPSTFRHALAIAARHNVEDDIRYEVARLLANTVTSRTPAETAEMAEILAPYFLAKYAGPPQWFSVYSASVMSDLSLPGGPAFAPARVRMMEQLREFLRSRKYSSAGQEYSKENIAEMLVRKLKESGVTVTPAVLDAAKLVLEECGEPNLVKKLPPLTPAEPSSCGAGFANLAP